MKNQKSKLITFMLAAMLGATALGGAIVSGDVTASADTAATTCAITDMFTPSSASAKADEADNTKLVFSYEKAGSVAYRRRNLALKWFDTNGQKQFMTLEFTLDENFKEVSFVIESTSAWSVKDGKAVNTVKFTKDSEGVKVQVNEQAATTVENPTAALTLSLGEGSAYGEFDVKLNGSSIGTFENIGENYAKYVGSGTKIAPLTINAEPAENAEKTQIVFSSINAQSLALTDGKITDNADPVLVVNDEIGSFVLGTGFSVDYVVIDVVDESVDTPKMTYYQYNPEDADAEELPYKTLTKSTSSTTGTYFMETTYDANWKTAGQDGHTVDSKSVYEVNGGLEFVSIKFELKDDALKNADKGVVYDLAWYAMETAKPAAVEAGGKQDIEYIKLDRNTEGAYYTFLKTEKTAGADGELGTKDDIWVNSIADEYKETYQTIIGRYQELIEKAAEGILAGSASDADVNFPEVTGLINDNNGYKNLKFTICYRSSTTSATSTSALSYNALKLRASKSGDYEIKIYATDKANNPMMYALDGELVEVNSSNIWDIEEIPSFTYHIENTGIKVQDGTSSTSRKETVTLDKTFTLSSFTVLGADSPVSEYTLYKVVGNVSESALYSITFEDIAKKAETVSKGDMSDAEFYKHVYELCLGSEGALKAINPYNAKIDKDNDAEAWNASDNKYNWNATSKSFVAAEEGCYVIIGVFTDPAVAAQKAAAYKVVLVEGPEDIIKGETEWLKNNIASVILFGVAALMLIAIVVLLLVKPSDETLEDLDKEENAEKAEEKSEVVEATDETKEE